VICAATNGHVDDIAIEDVRRFEADLLQFVENSHPGLLQSIREKKSLTDEITSDLQQALRDFKDLWKERHEGAAPHASARLPVGDSVSEPAGA